MQQLVQIPLGLSDNLSLPGVLTIPESSIGIVIFAHGSGSGKSSTRNQFVSRKLNEHNIGTLLFDLLTNGEQESDRKMENIIQQIPGATMNKFNIPLLSERLSIATDWVLDSHKNCNILISYFGSSTGAAAAFVAASKYQVSSIVLRSGRTDMVSDAILSEIISPCLFVVGDMEKAAIKIAKHTLKKLQGLEQKEIKIIQNASHLLEEEGAIESVAEISSQWFKRYFAPSC